MNDVRQDWSRTRDGDLADPDFWSRPAEEQHAVFARLRALERPVFFPGGSEGGFHALVRHVDVVAASKSASLFSSEPSATTPAPPRWVQAVFGDSMVNMDAPRHAEMRRIVQRAFTPRRVAEIETLIQKVCRDIVDDVTARRPRDFVTAVAAELPTQVICTMMGVPPERRRLVLEQVTTSTEFIGVAGRHRPRLRLPGRNLRAMARMHLLVRSIGRQRRRPTDDLISALVTANVDGERLDGRQLGAFFSLLLVAGIETTRNAIAHGLKLLSEHPDQRTLLQSNFDCHLPGAVEEILRYATPILQFRRRVTRDCKLGGSRLRAGDRVVLFYASANRDESVFVNPDRFDITRHPNPHLAFGGTGAHFCLGAHLARREMTTLFRELLLRLPDIHTVGEPELVPSSFDNRIRRMGFAFTPP